MKRIIIDYYYYHLRKQTDRGMGCHDKPLYYKPSVGYRNEDRGMGCHDKPLYHYPSVGYRNEDRGMGRHDEGMSVPPGTGSEDVV